MLSLKTDMRTNRGKVLQKVIDDSNPNCKTAGAMLIDSKCSTCTNTILNEDSVRCSKCKIRYHPLCLTLSIPSDFCQLLNINPCIWWCCLNCVLLANDDNVVNEELVQNETENASNINTTTSGQVGFSSNQADLVNNQVELMNTMISEKLSLFKTELLSSVNAAIENKLGVSKVDNCNVVKPLFSSIIQNSVSASNTVNVAKSPDTPNVIRIINAPHKSREVLVLTPIVAENTSQVSVEKVKKMVTSTLKNVQVSYINVNDKSGRISVAFPDTATRDTGAKSINEKGKLSSLGYSSRNATKMLPKITLNNVSSDLLDEIIIEGKNTDQIRNLEKQLIIDSILEKNPCIKTLVDEGHTLSVVFLSKSAVGSNLTIGLKVSPAIRSTILDIQRGAIYLSNNSYPFKDRFYFKQLNCQLIGHTSLDCPDNTKLPVCLYCMGGHKSSGCSLKNKASEHCCAKCLSSNHSNDAENYTSHNSASDNCPVVLHELKRLANNTELISKNVM